MKKKMYDPYSELVNKFNRGGVKYVIVGMSGINYYASRPQETFSTQYFDIFVKPTINNIKKATNILKKMNHNLTIKKGALEDFNLKEIVRQKNTIIATNPYGIVFELILAISGYTFDQMQKDATIFKAENVLIKVAGLKKLLQSKKAAGREKDKLFLKRFEILLKEKDA